VRRLNVLFLSWTYPKKNTPYLGIWAHQQALALSRKGVNVEAVSAVPYVPQFLGRFSAKMKQYADISDQEQYEGIRVHHPKIYRTKPGSWTDRMLFHFVGKQSKRIARELDKKLSLGHYDLIHAHNIFPDGAIAYYLHQKHGIPFVITLHAIDPYNSVPKRGVQKQLAERILQSASKVFAVSNRVKTSIAPYVNETRLQLFYNTFWTHELRTVPMMKTGNKIVTIASLIEQKGIHILLRAFQGVIERHPEFELFVIGSGEQYQQLIVLAVELNISHRITFFGALNHAETMNLLSQASIFCLPSWNEAFGVVYAEAMSLGIPVIGCRGEGIEDLVTNHVHGCLVEPKNVEELQKELLYLIENHNEAERIGENGKQIIEKLHPDVFGENMAELYHEIKN
jgi:teichuronic acid biosynthesis glycosyltransferase TuaC